MNRRGFLASCAAACLARVFGAPRFDLVEHHPSVAETLMNLHPPGPSKHWDRIWQDDVVASGVMTQEQFDKILFSAMHPIALFDKETGSMRFLTLDGRIVESGIRLMTP